MSSTWPFVHADDRPFSEIVAEAKAQVGAGGSEVPTTPQSKVSKPPTNNGLLLSSGVQATKPGVVVGSLLAAWLPARCRACHVGPLYAPVVVQGYTEPDPRDDLALFLTCFCEVLDIKTYISL